MKIRHPMTPRHPVLNTHSTRTPHTLNTHSTHTRHTLNTHSTHTQQIRRSTWGPRIDNQCSQGLVEARLSLIIQHMCIYIYRIDNQCSQLKKNHWRFQANTTRKISVNFQCQCPVLLVVKLLSSLIQMSRITCIFLAQLGASSPPPQLVRKHLKFKVIWDSWTSNVQPTPSAGT